MTTLCQSTNGICHQCGRPVAVGVRRHCRATSPIDKTAPKPLGLGDRLEVALTSIGITKERWGKFVGEEGLPTGCRSCDKRQERFNNADQWMRELGSQLGEQAVEAVSKLWMPVSWLTKRKPGQDQSGTLPEPPPTIKES